MPGKGEEDPCGLHAIANALSLALGYDPTEISYDERAMREHLFNCLEEEFLTMFLHTVLCKSNPSKMHQFHMRTFQESLRECSSDNLRPFERNFPGTKNAISSTFRYEQYSKITSIVSLTQCPKFCFKQTQQFFTQSISIYPLYNVREVYRSFSMHFLTGVQSRTENMRITSKTYHE